MLRPYFGDGSRLLIAHRGGSKRWPENTLMAFEGAYALGYRWIETDLHLTRDGEIVIFHDATLERTTDGRGRVRDFTLDELRRLDAAHNFTIDGRSHPHRGKGHRIPTLSEALETHDDLQLNLEMKGTDLELAQRLWAFIETHDVHDRVLVAAGHDAMTAYFRSLAGERLVTSAGRDGILRFWLGVKARLTHAMSFPFDALQVPIRHGVLRVVDRRFVDAAHAADLKVHVWTVDDPFAMRWLDGLGVDGIMTDRPEVLLDTVSD